MKKTFGIALLLMFVLTGFSQTTKLTITSKFINVEEGYDHDSRTQVLIDGVEVGVSEVRKETRKGAFAVEVPTGQHELQVVNWAFYEGTWEAHTIDNNYSIDATYATAHNFNKPEKLYLIFDVDNETLVSWKKPVKVKK